jgi:hypothetical protein
MYAYRVRFCRPAAQTEWGPDVSQTSQATVLTLLGPVPVSWCGVRVTSGVLPT